MRRQSDIGWTELIIGIILIIFGLFIVRQPVGIITWIESYVEFLRYSQELQILFCMSEWNALPDSVPSFL